MNNPQSSRSRQEKGIIAIDLAAGSNGHGAAKGNAKDGFGMQESPFFSVYNFAPFPYLLLNAEGVIRQVNLAGASLFELSIAELVGKKLSKFVERTYLSDLNDFLDSLSTGNDRNFLELDLILPGDKVQAVRVDGIGSNDNGPIAYYLAFTNISTLTPNVYVVEQFKEKLEMSLEASHAGTWELETDTMRFYLLLSNKILCPIPVSGFDGLYSTFIKYIHPDDQNMVQASFRLAIDSDVPINVICRFPTEDGKICYGRIKGQFLNNITRSKSLAGIIMNVTEQVLAEQRETELKDNQQRQVSMAILQAGENERRQISHMLHDSVSQLLYGVKMKIDLLKPVLNETGSLAEIDVLVDEAISDLRNISFALAPSILVEFGLPATLNELAGRLSSANMDIRIACFQDVERPALALELNIFRIIQELINNCIKHSGATIVDIQLRLSHEISIKVNDNGKGFNYSAEAANPTGSGLLSIGNRLALYNGKVKVHSVIGEGSAVTITLDL
ncbi:hypothetical protein A0256_19790 [Mucilaginibacter sp. PAMC 26640]|nr:hypothetical protein A0256_19790 [Mucilaginibacter sp. PAMC 26640]